MTVPFPLESQLVKLLFTMLMIIHLFACSTEENFNGGTTGSVNAITTGISLSWMAPTERDDGSLIALSEIAGYRVYYGTTQGNYTDQLDINDGTVDQTTLNNLSSGTYYLVVTTIDTDGRESSFSPEIVRTI